MSHTPGPWLNEFGSILGGKGHYIASVTGGDGNRFVDEEDNVECAANARLIAAAPELLEALQMLQPFLHELSIMQMDTTGECDRLIKSRQVVADAIRKATNP